MTGMRISLLLKKRVVVLEETLTFLSSLISEIRFSKNNIIKILSDLSSDEALNSLYFLKSFSCFTDNSDFRDIWIVSVKAFQYYKMEEKVKMLQLGAFLGSTDVESQIKTINRYIVFFENFLSKAETEYEKYGKTASLFGLFTGASVFILFI